MFFLSSENWSDDIELRAADVVEVTVWSNADEISEHVSVINVISRSETIHVF